MAKAKTAFTPTIQFGVIPWRSVWP